MADDTPDVTDAGGAELGPDEWSGMVETFLRSINHELRTPLTAVLGYTELLRAYEATAGAGYGQHVDALRRTTRRLAARIDDLLELARTISGQVTRWPSPVELQAVVQEVVAGYETDRISVDVPAAAVAFADPGHARRIIAHLVDNALTHTPPGTHVEVTASANDDVVTVAVADHGAGLDGLDVDAAVRPFVQGGSAGDAASPGLGVGLTIARELASANHGDIRVIDRPDGGVTVEVTLPSSAPSDSSGNPTVQLLRSVIADGPRMVYQPVVDLGTRAVIGYEALARGPAGSRLERPDRLFDAARSLGLLPELDWACRLAAGRQALAAGFASPLVLFGNIEPATLGGPVATADMQELEDLISRMMVVVELTERDLLLHPASVLKVAGVIRGLGARLALDDVGADPASVAFLPLLRPDVVKLDMALVREEPGPERARTIQSVKAYVESTGATLLAEGIEHDRHLERATALGATLGQGYHFGRPDALPTPPEPPRTAPIRRLADPSADADTPFDIVAQWDELRTSRKPLLIELSKGLERFALHSADDVLLLATFQDRHQFTPATARRYEGLGTRLPLVAAMARGMPPDPTPGVRGTDLSSGDRLLEEWTVVVLGNHIAAALIAVDLGDDGRDRERRFQHVLTHDRATVTAAARCMVRRLDPA